MPRLDLPPVDDADRPPPPPYGEFPDEIHLAQDHFDAGARVTDDGRVNINLNTKTGTLAQALRRQLGPAQALPSPADLPPAYIPPGLGARARPGQVPPPRLNIVIQIVGSRGDVQPFVALARVLRDTYHHRVRIATHPTFAAFVEDAGLEFFSIGGDPAELMAFMVKNPGLLPGRDALRTGEIARRRRMMEAILTGCWRSCSEAGDGRGPAPRPRPVGAPAEAPPAAAAHQPADPARRPFVADAIIANPPSFAHIHLAERLAIPLHMMFTMPWSPTRAFPHPLANVLSSNTDDAITNYVTYAMVEMMTWQGLGDLINRFREDELGLDPLSLMWAPGLLTRLQVPYTYCWSPALIPKPNDWGRAIDVSGFFFLDQAADYAPDPGLQAFLAAGPPPVYIGFGSIVVDDPDQLTRLILDAVKTARCRAIVSQGWGGLGAAEVGLPGDVLMLGNCPHDWLFSRVSCVVHHGGAGTTAAGIRAGRPTVVVPFFGDQPFWGAMVARAGAGPAPIPYRDLTAANLAAAIVHCLRPETLQRATELGAKISREKGVDAGAVSFHDHLDIDNMRCLLAPSRVAVWRVRRTRLRLSTLAAEVLVQRGHLRHADLKLYRPKEYVTEGQPWDPITGATSSLAGDVAAIVLGVADIPRRTFKTATTEPSRSPDPPARGGEGGGGEGRRRNSRRRSRSSSSSSSSRNAAAPAAAGAPPSLSASKTSLHPQKRSSPTESPESPEPPTSPPPPPPQQTAGFASPIATTSKAQVSAALSSPDPPAPAPAPLSRPSRSLPAAAAAAETPGRDRPARTGTDMGQTIDAAIQTTKGVSRVVSHSVKTPMNVCLGLAKGFRNAPRLYNDDTVRPPEKVTDLASGLRVAGREFSLGIYDGISGLVTQPWKGAEKEGGIGFLKGVGKGIAGAFLKPAGAMIALPAYTMQGVHASIKNAFATSMQGYITTSRIYQGREELAQSSPEEQADIVARWTAVDKSDLKEFHAMKKQQQQHKDGAAGPSLSLSPFTTSPPPPPAPFARRRSRDRDEEEDAEMERAIQASVSETSRGNPAEDDAVEQAIRESIAHMRRDMPAILGEGEGEGKAERGADTMPAAASRTVEPKLTDEEYQAQIQQAIEQSLVAHAAELQQQEQDRQQTTRGRPVGSGNDGTDHDNHANHPSRHTIQPFASKQPRVSYHSSDDDNNDDDAELRRAIKESKTAAAQSLPNEADDDELLRRAIDESAQAHAAELRDEEAVVEYIKRQSLADEERRRQTTAKGKMIRSGGAGGGRENENKQDDDEELSRALEESLREWKGAGAAAGPPPEGESSSK